MSEHDTPTDLTQPAPSPADATIELVELEAVAGEDPTHKRRMEVARLAMTFLTRNVAGLGQTVEGDPEAWRARLNVLGEYKAVERAYQRTAVACLGLIERLADEARGE